MTGPTLTISEAAFQVSITDLADVLGWRWLHVRRSVGHRNGVAAWQTTTNVKGWPDLALWHVGQRRFMVVELKSERGRLSPDQLEVLGSLAAAGVEAHTWRPSDWDLAVAVLRGEGRG